MMNEQRTEKTDDTVLSPQPSAQPNRGIARSAGIVSIAVMGSRVLGLVREQIFAAFFGPGVANDAFNIAFRIPNMLRDLFAEGALSAAFVSTFSRTLTQKGEREAWRLANLVSNGLVLVLSVIVIAGIAFAPQIVDLLFEASPNTNPEQAQFAFGLSVKLTRILFPFLVTVSLAAVAMGILNSKDRYGVPASASTMFNVGSIIGGLFFAYLFAPGYIANGASALWHQQQLPRDDVGAAAAITGMAIGTLVGGMMQWLIQVPSLRSVGFRWEPILNFRDEGVRQVMRMMAPAIIGSAALQVNLVVNTTFATSLGEGRVSWLQFAFRLIYLPIGMFGVAISTATLPAASRAAAADNMEEFRRTIAQALRLTFLLTIPSAVGLIVLNKPIIALIYQHGGRFTENDTAQTGAALAYYAIGLTAYSVVRVLAPAFYALKDTRVPMIASLVSIVTNYAVAKTTVGYLGLGHRGLALSISAVSIVNFALLFVFLRRKVGRIEDGRLLSTFAKVTAAAVVMGGICWLVSDQIEFALGTASLLARLIDVGASIAIGIGVFYLLARMLKVGELDQMTSVVKRKLGKK
ncbi:MAG: murein biosynthesis integral membrane protein MurJ [Blastocatellia bacterium]